MVKVTITAPNGFAGFKGMVEYDTNAFEYVATTKSGDMAGLITSSAKDGVVSTVYASDVDHMPTKMEFDDELGEDVEKACTYYYQLRFTAKSDIVNGDYDFGFTFDAPNLANAAGETLTGEANEGAKITITGGKDPAPSFTKATAKVVESKNNKADKAEGEAYTQGFKFEVIGNDETVTAVPFTLTADGTTKPYAGFTGLNITGATPVYFGLNVKEIPADKTVAANFSLVVAE
jgi:hypothetical protein